MSLCHLFDRALFYLFFQELARKGLYVVYASLAGKNLGAYPCRSKIADIINKFRGANQEQTTMFFECYIAANLVNVEICIKYGISPVGFFESQVGFRFFSFQHTIARYVEYMYQEAYFARYFPEERPENVEERGYQGYLSNPLQRYRTDADELFSALAKHMRNHPQMEAYLQPTMPQQPIIICMDEARPLFKEPLPPYGDEFQFLAFRGALRHQSKLSENGHQQKFFVLLLDTSKIPDYTAPRKVPSLKKEMWIQKILSRLFVRWTQLISFQEAWKTAGRNSMKRFGPKSLI